MRISDWSSDVCSSDLSVSNRRIDVASRGEQIPPPLAMMFTMPVNGVRMLAAPGDQGWFIVKVDGIKKGDIAAAPAIVESTRAQFNQFAGEEYVAQFARAIAADVGLKRNEKAIARLKQIGRAHVGTPVTNAQLVFRLLLE